MAIEFYIEATRSFKKTSKGEPPSEGVRYRECFKMPYANPQGDLRLVGKVLSGHVDEDIMKQHPVEYMKFHEAYERHQEGYHAQALRELEKREGKQPAAASSSSRKGRSLKPKREK